MVASGVRIGTPAVTMRGFDEDDFREVGRIIVGALADGADVDGARARAASRSATERPLYPGFRGYTSVRDVTDGASSSRSTTRSSSTSSGYLRDVTRRPRCSASSSTS